MTANGSVSNGSVSNGAGVLSGVKVLDLTWFGAGPIGMRTIASLGADLIRVETEKRPDGLRIAGPKPEGATSLNVSGYYNNYNADKRSITIDLTTERGHELGIELVQWADIFMTNMTSRAVRKIGMTWDVVRQTNPGIIACYQPMQGMTGPHEEFGGFGAILSTICGVNGFSGFAENDPVGVGSNYPDYVVNPIHAVIAILAALRHKRRTGEGQLIDMSQLESSTAAMALPVFTHDNGGLPAFERTGNRVPYAAPHGVYRVVDGDAERDDQWIALACLDEAQWGRAAEAMGHAEWAGEARFATLGDRKENEDALDALVSEWAAAQAGDGALRRLQAANVPAGLVLRASEVLADEQLVDRGYFLYLDHVEAGRRAYDGSGFHLSKSSAEPKRAAPLLGEHTYEIATDVLGLTPEEIGDLVVEQVLY